MDADTTPMVWADDPTRDDKERCAVCGKEVKGDIRRFIEVIDGGGLVARPGSNPDVEDPGYMGFFPVGPTCAKRFKGFVHVVKEK